jgi:hypothetical protein
MIDESSSGMQTRLCMILSVTRNLVRTIHCSDKSRGVRDCTVRCDLYSNLSFAKCLASLMHICFHIRVHEAKHDRTEQNKYYFIGQSIMTSNEWYTSLGTITIIRAVATFMSFEDDWLIFGWIFSNFIDLTELINEHEPWSFNWPCTILIFNYWRQFSSWQSSCRPVVSMLQCGLNRWISSLCRS